MLSRIFALSTSLFAAPQAELDPCEIALNQPFQAELTGHRDSGLAAPNRTDRWQCYFRTEASGAYTIEARSYSFDAQIELRDLEGNILALDDDGLLGIHARIIAEELAAKSKYVVEIRATDGASGPFAVEIYPGRPSVTKPADSLSQLLSDCNKRLNVHTAALGPHHADVVKALNVNAMVLSDAGHCRSALDYLNQAYEMLRVIPQASADLRLEICGNIATLLSDELEELNEALPFAREAAELARSSEINEAQLAKALLQSGNLLIDLKRWEEAIDDLEEASVILAKQEKFDFDLGASVASSCAVALSCTGRFEEAESQLTSILDRLPRNANCLPAAAIDVHMDLGRFYQWMDLNEQSVEQFTRALSITRNQPSGSSEREADILFHLGAALFDSGHCEGSKAHLERAVQVSTGLVGAVNSVTIEYELEFLRVLWATGDEVRSRQEFERLWRAVQSDGEIDDVTKAHVLLRKSHFERVDQNLDQGIACSLEALRLLESGAGSEPMLQSNAHELLSWMYCDLGEQDRALDHCEKALNLRRSVLGDFNPGVVMLIQDAAHIARSQGDYAKAKKLTRQAIDSGSVALGADHPVVAEAESVLAEIAYRLGQFEEACEITRSVIEKLEVAYGPNHPKVAAQFVNYSTITMKSGRYEESLAYCNRAMDILDRMDDSDPEVVASCLHNISGIYSDCGFHLASAQAGNASLQSYGNRLYQLSTLVKRLTYQAVLARERGDYVRVGEMIDRVIRVWNTEPKRALAFEVFDHITSIACMLMDVGRVAEAKQIALEAYEELASRMRGVIERSPGTNVHALQRTELGLLDIVMQCSIGSTEQADLKLTYRMLTESKCRIARTRRSIARRIADNGRERSADVIARFREVQRKLSSTLIAERPDSDSALSVMDELDRYWAAEREVLTGASGSEESWDGNIDELLSCIPSDSCLIDVWALDAYEPAVVCNGVPLRGGTRGQPRVIAWILRSGDGGVEVVDCGSLSSICSAIRSSRAEASKELVLSQYHDGPELVGEHEARLRGALWDPLATRIRGCSRIYVCPDMFVGDLPWEIIRQENGKFLLEDYEISYVYSAEILLRGRANRETDARDLLSVGGVEYGAADELPVEWAIDSGIAKDEPSGAHSRSWPRLPWTSVEARKVSELHAIAFPKAERCFLEGLAASEERLKVACGEAEYIHIATHGFYCDVDWMSTGREAELNAQPGASRKSNSYGSQTLAEVRSALVCAGANSGCKAGGDDGYLTGAEVSSLDLSGCKVVVLAACETAIGASDVAEGFFSMKRSFLLAGAMSVVSSVWNVPEKATTELMESFYRHLWMDHEDPATALRAAKLEMLEANRQSYNGRALPGTWGAFVIDLN